MKYRVCLTPEKRETLETIVRQGNHSARKIRRAHALLLSDAGKDAPEIASLLRVCAETIRRTRQRFVEEGLEAALEERPRSGRPRLLDAALESYLVALACSPPPEGRTEWTMQLLADRFVTLTEMESLSDETVRQVLKKTHSSPGK